MRSRFCLCARTGSSSESASTAKVIGAEGELREYAEGVTAEEVISGEWFLCNSDDLYLGKPIPRMRGGDHLEAGHVYFQLHPSKLRTPLSAPEMAALTLTAAAALHTAGTKTRNSPTREGDFNHPSDYDCHVTVNSKSAKLLRSASVAKLQKAASRRAKMAVRSFRLRLATIYET